MMIDLDHLMANPIYDPNRCSIGFHPLHGLLPIGFYIGLYAIARLRILGVGLLIHIGLDALDCLINNPALLLGSAHTAGYFCINATAYS